VYPPLREPQGRQVVYEVEPRSLKQETELGGGLKWARRCALARARYQDLRSIHLTGRPLGLQVSFAL
jgi:hypothetical protein